MQRQVLKYIAETVSASPHFATLIQEIQELQESEVRGYVQSSDVLDAIPDLFRRIADDVEESRGK